MSRILDNENHGRWGVGRTYPPSPIFTWIYRSWDKVKDQLQIFIEAAKMRDEALDHVLCLALQVSGKQPRLLSLPMNWESIKQTSVLLSKSWWSGSDLNDLESGDALIDEIHRFAHVRRGTLQCYGRFLTSISWLVRGKVAGVHLNCHLTLIGAYDTSWDAQPPQHVLGTGHMEYYTHDDLAEIVERTAEIFWDGNYEAASELALRSRGDSYRHRLQARARLAQIIHIWLMMWLRIRALTMLDVDHEGLTM